MQFGQKYFVWRKDANCNMQIDRVKVNLSLSTSPGVTCVSLLFSVYSPLLSKHDVHLVT